MKLCELLSLCPDDFPVQVICSGLHVTSLSEGYVASNFYFVAELMEYLDYFVCSLSVLRTLSDRIGLSIRIAPSPVLSK